MTTNTHSLMTLYKRWDDYQISLRCASAWCAAIYQAA
jgi:hypothetical protein